MKYHFIIIKNEEYVEESQLENRQLFFRQIDKSIAAPPCLTTVNTDMI